MHSFFRAQAKRSCIVILHSLADIIIDNNKRKMRIFAKRGLTLYIIADSIQSSMVETKKNAVLDIDTQAFLYSGLASISSEGRERLKQIAQSLIAVQESPGSPVPNNVQWEILRESTSGLP